MNKTLFVFDFDDTLCMSEMGSAYVHHANGTMTILHGHKWSTYQEQPGDTFDFRDFDELKNPCANTPVWRRFLAGIASHGKENVWICTARGFPEPLTKWLEQMGYHDINIACMAIPAGTNNGIYKSRFVASRLSIAENVPYSRVEFYDDRDDCVEHVAALRNTFPEVEFDVYQVDGTLLHKV